MTAWGAGPGEPLFQFPRALRTLLDMGAAQVDADQIVDSVGQGDKGGGKGKKGGGKGKQW